MKRRDAVKLTSLALGAAVSAPAWLFTLESCSTKKNAGAPAFFSGNQSEIISEIADILIPKTGTPGALEAGVPDFIEKFVEFVYTAEQQGKFLKGMEELEKTSDARYGKGFLKITPQQKSELLSNLNREALKDESHAASPRQGPFILMIKEMTLLGYFTSMPGATETLQYLPIPGEFKGCIDLSQVGRAWATE